MSAGVEGMTTLTQFAAVGTPLQIEVLGERKDATVLVDSPYDPENKDLRAQAFP